MIELLELPTPQTAEDLLDLQRLAYIDGLTNILNRRAFDQMIDRASGGDYILFVDFDNLKPLNAQFGHLFANNLLRLVADVLRSHLRRKTDSAYRFGGDEFVVLLGDCSTEYAAKIAESVRVAVSKLATEHGQICSVSIGGAPIVDDKRAAINAADAAMYESKAKGKNWVTITRSPSP